MFLEYLLICATALLGSSLTLFSGFGLGTVLLPVFGMFFPVQVAIALTAIVHFLNNTFKLLLLGNKAQWKIVVRFGIPSIIAAFVGAYALSWVSTMPPLMQYQLAGKLLQITPVKLLVALLLFFFSLVEINPRLSNIRFGPRYLVLGGLLSGFFGGLSGNQGALRSAFLLRAGLDKEHYIATGVVIACFIDITRLSVYSSKIFANFSNTNITLLACAASSAFVGAWLGNKLLGKITIKTLHYIVAIALFCFAILLGAGII